MIPLRRSACASLLIALVVSAVISGRQTQPASSTPGPAQDTVSPEVQRAVDTAINERLRDSRVVDVETSQAIASRLSDWAKLFGFFVGIPLALFAGTLGFLGFRTYRDFTSTIAQARQEVLQIIDKSREDAKKIEEDLLKLKTQLQESSALASQVQDLSQKVARIENVVRFRASPSLTPEIKNTLTDTLKNYSSYLKSVGLPVSLKTPTVLISDKELNAYYEPTPKNRIVIHPEIAEYPDTALREFTHHVLHLLKLEWEWDGDITGLESALADYLPSSFLGRPEFGKDLWPVFERHHPGLQVPSRDLKNNHSFAEIDFQKDAQHRYGTIWGGAFWELRESAGQNIIDKLLLAAWKEFDFEASKTNLKTFPLALLQQDKILESGKYANEIREVFRRRKLEV